MKTEQLGLAERLAEVYTVREMMENLPRNLLNSSENSFGRLFQENEAIFSKSEYDIGRTPHVECRIVAGEHRPFRQNLCRHAFAHLELIVNRRTSRRNDELWPSRA